MTTTEQAPPKCSYGIVPLPEFERQYLAEPQAYLVDGLIADQSVNIVAGDSGLGKSPWAYHLGFSIATGTPFLGYAVRPGPVLYIDLENGRSGIFRLTKSLARHLGLTELPPEFYLLQTRDHLHQLEAMVRDYKPALVIIDSLRAYRPGAEQNNENAADVINDSRRIAKRYGVAFLIIHHIKKPGENGAPGDEGIRAVGRGVWSGLPRERLR